MTRGRGPERLLASVAVLLAAAAGALAASSSRDEGAAERGREFFRATGGLGLGNSLTLDRCAYGFDPRLDDVCASRHEPVAGGGSFCPRHAGVLPRP